MKPGPRWPGVTHRPCFALGQPPLPPPTPGQCLPLTRVPVKVPASPPSGPPGSLCFPPPTPLPVPAAPSPWDAPRPLPPLPAPGTRLSLHFSAPPSSLLARPRGPAVRAPAAAPSRPRARGGGAERGGGREARGAAGRRGTRALAVSPGRARGHAQSRARALTAGRRRLTEAVAPLFRTQGRPQRQPRAVASGAGAGTAGAAAAAAPGVSPGGRGRGGDRRGRAVRCAVRGSGFGDRTVRGDIPSPGPPPRPFPPRLR